MKKIKDNKFDNFFIGLLLLVALSLIMCFTLIQPFGEGPDEVGRYKVVEYIKNHGKLPVGSDPEVAIEGFGGSYAYQPILSYMIQGYVLRMLAPFNLAFQAELVVARFICVLFGIAAGFYSFMIGRELWQDKRKAYLLGIAIVFLPQNLFIYSYVNTDSCGLLSIAMIIYCTVKIFKGDMGKLVILQMCVGLNLCLQSYYNCYGILLTTALSLIILEVCRKKKDNDKLFLGLSREFIYKALVLILSCLVFSGWWFIRNGIMYRGDIFALRARALDMESSGIRALAGDLLKSYSERGISLYHMVFGTDYFTLVWKSFIGMFGPMLVPTHHYIYEAYKYLFILVAIIGIGLFTGFIVLRFIKKKTMDSSKGIQIGNKAVFNFYMLFSMLIPIVLALVYSYKWDYQPQGRYYLPMLVPFMYFCISSIGCAGDLLENIIKKRIVTVLYHLLYCYIILAAVYSSFYVIPRYYGLLR